MTNIDSIVAGVGIWGCTVARRLAEAGRKVLERRAGGGEERAWIVWRGWWDGNDCVGGF